MKRRMPADFYRLWAAYSVSLVGSQITIVAVPLAALMLKATPLQLGVIAACGYLPFLLFGLPVGVLVDRWPLRPLLIAVDVGRAVTLTCVPLAWAYDALSIGLLAAIMFIHGTLTVVADVAHPSFLRLLVEKDQLVEGNTRLQGSYSAAELAGPSAGGVLVSLVSAPVALLVDAASFLVSAAILTPVRRTEPSPPTAKVPLRLIAQIRGGLAYVGRHELLRPLVMCMAFANFFDLFGMVQVLLPVYAVNELQLSATMYGIALSVANVGALAGVFANGILVRNFGFGRSLVITSVLPGIGVLLLALAESQTGPAWIITGLAIAGFGIAVFNVNQMGLRQHVTPASLQGRMNATVRFLIWGMIPAGALAGGILSEHIGVRAALVVAGIGSVLSAAPLVLSRLGSVRAVGDICEDRVEHA